METLSYVLSVLQSDQRETVEKVVSEVGISVGSCHSIHQNASWVSTHGSKKFVSSSETQMTLAELITMAYQDKDFLNNINKWDKTWRLSAVLMSENPQTKHQPSKWKSTSSPQKQIHHLPRNKFCLDKIIGKVTCKFFFDSQGSVHHEFIPDGKQWTRKWTSIFPIVCILVSNVRVLSSILATTICK